MKSTKNMFEVLGLDPYYLRGIPDELVANLVKSAFRILISYYHDDKRDLSHLNYDKKIKEEIKFDQRRNEIMESYSVLSTPEGRMNAFSALRTSNVTLLKTQLSELSLNTTLEREQGIQCQIDILLDKVGALEKSENSGHPIGNLFGGRILTSYSSGFDEFGQAFEFNIGNAGLVVEIHKCKMVPGSKILHPKRQIWCIDGSTRREDQYAVRGTESFFPTKGLTVLGLVDFSSFKYAFGRDPKALLEYDVLKPFTGLPFHRLPVDGMRKMMSSFAPVACKNSFLVLADAKKIFYFPGMIRGVLTPTQLNGLGGKLV